MKAFFKHILSTAIGMMIGTLLSLILIPIAIVLLSKGFQQGSAKPIVDKSILHLRLSGQLVEKKGPLDLRIFGEGSIFQEDRTIGLFELQRAIETAKTDRRIAGMYLEFGSLDAGWASVVALRRYIEDFTKSGKWAYAYADQYDEKTYFLASGANQIFIEPHGGLELNGLSVSEAFLKGLFEKLEMQPVVFRVGKFKSAIEPFIQEKMSEENRLQTRTLVDDIWSVFRSTVSSSLKVEEAQVDEYAAQLSATSAEQAKTLGLVHETLFRDQVEDRMKSFTVGKDNELELVGAGRLLRDRGLKKASGSGKKIAVIFAEGEITSGIGGPRSIGSESLRQDILDAKADENVVAVVLRINSPGGDALASDVIWRELMVTDQEIPVVVSMGDVAASGGYYIATAGRYIFAEPTTITGSIGVFGLLFNTQKFFQRKIGVQFDHVTTHPHADIGSSIRPVSEFESKVIQGEVERIYKRFLDIVQEGRGFEKRADLENMAEGRVWSGVKAKELGLIDELGGLQQAIAKAGDLAGVGANFDLDIYPKEADPLMLLVERLSGEKLRLWLSRMGLGPATDVVDSIPNLKSGIYARMLSDLKIR